MQAVGNTRKRATLVEPHSQLSIRNQCKLLNIPRSLFYYQLKTESRKNQILMELIDRLHLQDPAAGTRRMSKLLRRLTGEHIGRKRVRRLMRLMGIEAIYPRKRTTIPGGPSGIYPYRLKGLTINRANQVWCADISVLQQHRVQLLLTLCEKLHRRWRNDPPRSACRGWPQTTLSGIC